MPICVVQGCHYRRGQKSRKQLKFEKETGQMVTLHRFPKDPSRRLMWIDALTGWVDRSTENSFICSTHFTDDSWEQSSVNRRLKADAIPTLFPQGVDASPVARKRRRTQPKVEALEAVKLEPEAPPATEDPNDPLNPVNQEPEVLLTELHRADPVVANCGPYGGYPPDAHTVLPVLPVLPVHEVLPPHQTLSAHQPLPSLSHSHPANTAWHTPTY